jgi:DNA polymerase-3 subunit epsilon
MNILSLDFETSWTTPVNPKQCRIFEIGAVLYDWEKRIPIKMMSEFIHESDHPLSPKELIDLTGITDEMKAEWGIPLKSGISLLNDMVEKADYIIAHNGNEFDRPLLYAETERIGAKVADKPWIDSKVDIDYPPKVKSRSLSQLCTEHRFLNPFAHRALFDALSVIEILKHYRIDDVIESSKQPNCRVIASVSFDKKHLAKDRGYHWDGDNKVWWKGMKSSKAQKEKEDAPFAVQIREVE